MDKKQFWKLIDSTRAAASDMDEHAELLEQALLKRAPAKIAAFQNLFDEYHVRADHRDLWAAAFIIGGGCSDDGFTDFRYWLISKGEAVFEAVLADVNALLEHVTGDDLEIECQAESFGYAAGNAWEEKTDSSRSDMPYALGIQYNTAGDDWEEDDLPERFPALWERFGDGDAVHGEDATGGHAVVGNSVVYVGLTLSAGQSRRLAEVLLAVLPGFERGDIGRAVDYVEDNLRNGDLHLRLPKAIADVIMGLTRGAFSDVNAVLQEDDPLDAGGMSCMHAAFSGIRLLGKIQSLQAQAEAADGESTQEFWRQANAAYVELVALEPDSEEIFLNWGGMLNHQAEALAPHDLAAAREVWAAAADKYRRALALKPDYALACYNWGIALGAEANQMAAHGAAVSSQLRTEALAKYAQAIAINRDYAEAHNNRGATLVAQAKTLTGPAALALCEEAFAHYAEALVQQPDNVSWIFNWALGLAGYAQRLASNDMSAARRAWAAADEKYAAAQALEPGNGRTLHSWGDLLRVRGKLLAATDSEAARRSSQEACEKYRSALAARPSHLDTLLNWGAALMDLAQLEQARDLPLARQLWAEANARFARALQLDPGYIGAALNWAATVGCEGHALAAVDPEEAMRCHALAGEKYRYVLDRQPRRAKTWDSLAGTFICRTSLEPDPARRAALFDEAGVCLDRAETLVPGIATYNWACVESLRGNAEAGVAWLRRCHQAGYLSNIAHMQSDRDLTFLRESAAYRKFLRDLKIKG